MHQIEKRWAGIASAVPLIETTLLEKILGLSDCPYITCWRSQGRCCLGTIKGIPHQYGICLHAVIATTLLWALWTCLLYPLIQSPSRIWFYSTYHACRDISCHCLPARVTLLSSRSKEVCEEARWSTKVRVQYTIPRRASSWCLITLVELMIQKPEERRTHNIPTPLHVHYTISTHCTLDTLCKLGANQPWSLPTRLTVFDHVKHRDRSARLRVVVDPQLGEQTHCILRSSESAKG